MFSGTVAAVARPRAAEIVASPGCVLTISPLFRSSVDTATCTAQEVVQLEEFTPSIDWGNQLAASTWWVLEAWALSAVCVLVTVVLLIRYTTWARRFWRVTGEYFTGTASLPVWSILAVLLLSVILEVRI